MPRLSGDEFSPISGNCWRQSRFSVGARFWRRVSPACLSVPMMYEEIMREAAPLSDSD
jgi:hypothetical protein